MPIYSNLYANLARQGVTKTFTHGYAQSVVAATHPQLYASSNRPGFSLQRRKSKLTPFNSYHFQNAFHTSASSSSALVLDSRPDKIEGGLDAYFDAWKKSHAAGEPEKEWVQFQFAKRIEWKPQSTQVEVEAIRNVEVVQQANEANLIANPLERAYSARVVDDLRKVEVDAHEKAALAKVDAAIEQEIKLRTDQTTFGTEASALVARVPTPVNVPSPALTAHSTLEKSPSSNATSISVVSEQSQSSADHLTKLAETGRYAEIPAAFEAMLVANVKPIASAYNSLLDAAVHLPAERIEVVPKALDVYSDMLRRKVLPTTATYNKLINILASRSLEVTSSRRDLEKMRDRFGGMDEVGKFMFASHDMEYKILAEDDRLDLAMRLFEASIAHKECSFPPETYHKLITACSEAGRVPQMVRLYAHMESRKVIPLALTFSVLVKGFTQAEDLNSAVETYNEYKRLAVASDHGKVNFQDRNDTLIYAAVLHAYITSDKIDGALKFYGKLMQAFGMEDPTMNSSLIFRGFIEGLLDNRMFSEALYWAEKLQDPYRLWSMALIASDAADKGDKATATTAFNYLPITPFDATTPTVALMALSVREGDVAAAQHYWQILTSLDTTFDELFIQPTTMFAVAMIGSGQVAEGMTQAEQMFARITSAPGINIHLHDQVNEAVQLIAQFMETRGIIDPRGATLRIAEQSSTPPGAYAAVPACDDTFDPYAASTDFKGSTLIADELEKGNNGRKAARLNEALNRLRNIRRAGRHPRYITYAKLISAAAREERVNLVQDILHMARSDIPLLAQYPIVRYGWASILDAMIGAYLTLGKRALAAQYHQELNEMGGAPTANTFGLYITTLKESTKTFDEASEAVKIFHRAKYEGVEPSSFLYNALIGKLGKARRIDDCLFYFAEMRSLGIRPTSVTYGTIVNALCRVSDEKFAEELFEEMESMLNYKARAAPYNSLMQFFLTTKRDKSKVLAYYQRMKSKGIQPTNHTYKLLVDTHATLEPINMEAAEAVLDVIRSTGQQPEAVHYASLIHAKGCVRHDMDGAKAIFDSVLLDSSIRPQACLFQALFESMVANHRVTYTESVLRDMLARRVEMTPYIANTLIHGWAHERNIEQCEQIFTSVPREKREPSTYEAMTRAYLNMENRKGARIVVEEMLSRGYPGAVSGKVYELLGGSNTDD